MKIAIFIKNPALKLDERLLSLKAKLSDAGFEYYMGESGAFQAQKGTDAVLNDYEIGRASCRERV